MADSKFESILSRACRISAKQKSKMVKYLYTILHNETIFRNLNFAHCTPKPVLFMTTHSLPHDHIWYKNYSVRCSFDEPIIILAVDWHRLKKKNKKKIDAHHVNPNV